MTNTRADDLERVLVADFCGTYQGPNSGGGLLGTEAHYGLAAYDTRVASTEQIPSRESGDVQNDFDDNPKLGVLWYIVYTLKMTAILYITKAIYELNPNIEVL